MSEELMNNINDDSCTSDCSTCGSSCGSAPAPSDIIIPLAFGDGTVVNCKKLTTFTVDDNEYLVLLPLDENGQNTSGEVFVYRFVTTETGETALANIESDEEYAKVAEVFNKMVADVY